VNSLSLVRFDRNDYSVPTDFAYHDVTCLGGIDTVHIVSGTDVVATHPRDWNKEQVTFDPCHYLALLERKPGALDFARPLEDLHLPGCFAVLRRRLEADLGSAGTVVIGSMSAEEANAYPRWPRKKPTTPISYWSFGT
jgi:hypothetical protein